MRERIKTPKYIMQGIAPKHNKTYAERLKTSKKTTPCSDCGEFCSGKLNIQARKNKVYPFCTDCFNRLELEGNTYIRKRVKDNKHGVTV